MLRKPVDNVLELIGSTPVVKLHSFDTNGCELYVKMEHMNPGDSIKDRIAIRMIEAAEKSGELKPGGTIVEATAGNTGLGLTLVGRLKGYKVLLVMPDKMSVEKISLLRAFGATVLLTRSDVEKGHPDYYQEVAAAKSKEIENSFYINQFGNPNNVAAHQEGTGPEIFEQLDRAVDAVVCGVGSGGTLTGISNFFAEKSPNTDIVLADPEGSILATYIKTGKFIQPGSWLVEGMGEDFIPSICDLSRVKHAYTVSDRESFNTTRELLLNEGILAGTSAGCLVAAALKYCKEQTEPKRVVTFICDSGSRYLRKVFNDFWMMEQGLIERESTGDLRDLVSRRYDEGSVVTVTPDDTLATTHNRMRMYDVSQLPVMRNGEIVGIIDEEDILLAARQKKDAFKDNVEVHMVTGLKTLSPSESLDEAISLLEGGFTPLVKDEKNFYGLITRSDVINYLRLSSLRQPIE
ncbi:MAG: pyridoxal-phosphate dependent enzyme [Bdellovibrionales bacterium]|nr:pyridoxal-phosphate dependent enzyme [Bdellovibrionales bacterium]